MKKSIQQAENTLVNLKNLEIIECLRLFKERDLENIPKDKKDLESDGVVYLKFSNNRILSFHPSTENFSVDVDYIEDIEFSHDLTNITNNEYWRDKINKKIVQINLLFSSNQAPYGICFLLENEAKVNIEYISESEYTFDALVLR